MNPAYFDQISHAFLEGSGRGLVLSPRDQLLVAGWAREGVPAKVVVDAPLRGEQAARLRAECLRQRGGVASRGEDGHVVVGQPRLLAVLAPDGEGRSERLLDVSHSLLLGRLLDEGAAEVDAVNAAECRAPR